MTTLVIEHGDAPWGTRGERLRDAGDRWAHDELAGRAVWLVSGLEPGREGALALSEQLRSEGAAGACDCLDVAGHADLDRLAGRIDSMLGGGAARRFTAADHALCAETADRSDALLGEEVRAGDVVILRDSFTALLAPVARERGAHVVWHMHIASADSAGRDAAWTFMRGFTGAVDAYAVSWGEADDDLAALMPAADRVAACRGWSHLLADLVERDRDETVGGRLHARPEVAVR